MHDETNREPSFSYLGEEAVALINETRMSGGVSFVKSDAIIAWEDELKNQLFALDCKFGEKQASLYRSVVDHRLRGVQPVSGAFKFGNAEVLVGNDVPEEERIRQVSAILITAATRITCVTKLIDSFLTEDNVHLVNPGEIVETYARAMGLHVNVVGEILALESAISKSHWNATLEEILGNAQKYGANSVTIWADEGKLCLGNNGRELGHKIQDSGGKGTKIIGELGFSDYKLRSSTEHEKQLQDINVVAQFNLI